MVNMENFYRRLVFNQSEPERTANEQQQSGRKNAENTE